MQKRCCCLFETIYYYTWSHFVPGLKLGIYHHWAFKYSESGKNAFMKEGIGGGNSTIGSVAISTTKKCCSKVSASCRFYVFAICEEDVSLHSQIIFWAPFGEKNEWLDKTYSMRECHCSLSVLITANTWCSPPFCTIAVQLVPESGAAFSSERKKKLGDIFMVWNTHFVPVQMQSRWKRGRERWVFSCSTKSDGWLSRIMSQKRLLVKWLAVWKNVHVSDSKLGFRTQ